MAISIKQKNDAIDILKNYQGRNPYLLGLQRDVITFGNTSKLNDFAVEYTNKNWNYPIVQLNKIAYLADWYQEKKKEDWKLDFLPSKIRIVWLLGETTSTYHAFVQYRNSVPPVEVFLSKNGILNNFLLPDYQDIQVDFDRYDRLSEAIAPGRKIKEHQKEGVKFLLSRKKCILADDQGLGKTLELSVAAVEGNFDVVLVICPASLKTNWYKELSYYVPQRDITIIGSCNDMKVSELEEYLGYGIGKSGLKRDALLAEAKERGKWKENRFVIINYDILDEVYQLTSARSEKNIQAALDNSPIYQFINNKKALIIVDEAHKLSDQKSTRYKIIKDLLKKGNPDSVYLATGTPLTNHPANFYCLLNLLGDPIADDYKFFMEHYCKAIHVPINAKEKEKRDRIQRDFIAAKGKRNWYELTDDEKKALNDRIDRSVRVRVIPQGGENLDELRMRVAHLYLRRVKEDLRTDDGVAALPPKHIHERIFELDAMQLMEYNRLWEEYEMAQLEENPYKQLDESLLSGAIYRKYLSNLMVPNTIELTNRCIAKGEKVIIACCYDEELNTLAEYFGDKCVTYNGKMSSKQKDKAKDEFLNNPDVMVFIGNIISAGVGLTLTVSRVIIFNNFDYVYANNAQMEDRIHRIGQTRDCHIYYQFYANTQYEKMWNTVLKKKYISNEVIKKESEK